MNKTMLSVFTLTSILTLGTVAFANANTALLDGELSNTPDTEANSGIMLINNEYQEMMPISAPINAIPIGSELSEAEAIAGSIPKEWLRGSEQNQLSDTELVDRAYELGLIDNSSLSDFKPNDNLSREYMAQFAIKFSESYYPVRPMTMKLCPFSDVNLLSKTLQNAVQDACAYLFFNGYEDGSFGVGRAITQEEFKIVLRRVAKESDTDLVDQVVRNKALLPSISRGDALRYLNEFSRLVQANS